MKVWHHFMCGRLVLTLHTSEVKKERAPFLFGIKKGLKINVGQWIQENIHDAIQTGTDDILYPTLLTELIASHGIKTTGHEVLQPKSSLNQRAIKWIITMEF